VAQRGALHRAALYWHGLHVRDRRAVRSPSAVADECAAHLRGGLERIVPPISGGLTPVFHRYYDEPDPTTRPAYLPPADSLRGHPRR